MGLQAWFFVDIFRKFLFEIIHVSDLIFQVWIYLLFILIEWLIPDEEKSLVDLDTQTKFILDRKRVELRENRLIAAQYLERQDQELHNDGSRTTRSTLTQSSINSWTRISNHLPSRASQYNDSRRSSMLPSRISNIKTILAARPVPFQMPTISDDSAASTDSRSSNDTSKTNSFTQE